MSFFAEVIIRGYDPKCLMYGGCRAGPADGWTVLQLHTSITTNLRNGTAQCHANAMAKYALRIRQSPIVWRGAHTHAYNIMHYDLYCNIVKHNKIVIGLLEYVRMS